MSGDSEQTTGKVDPALAPTQINMMATTLPKTRRGCFAFSVGSLERARKSATKPNEKEVVEQPIVRRYRWQHQQTGSHKQRPAAGADMVLGRIG